VLTIDAVMSLIDASDAVTATNVPDSAVATIEVT